jgi:hypothetical protein
MARFVIKVPKKKKQFRLLIIYSKIFVALAVFVFCEIEKFGNFGFYFVLAGFLLSDILELINGEKEKFIDIQKDRIRWQLTETLNNKKAAQTIEIEWEDIRWIKKENNGDISFYKYNSFFDFFYLDGFEKKDKQDICNLIEEIANQKHIRLVNFSEKVLVPA